MCAIVFFDEHNRQSTKSEIFGLCDDIEGHPAYIDSDLSNKDVKWIGIVKNANKKEILFYPIGNCIEITRPDGSDAQKCEGVLCHDSNRLIFSELKDRKITPDDWLKKAENQILETLSYFYKYYKSNNYKIKAWICNKQLTTPNYYAQIAKFKDTTKKLFNLKQGLILYVDRSISLK